MLSGYAAKGSRSQGNKCQYLIIKSNLQCHSLEVPAVLLGGPEEGISQMLDSTGKERPLIRQDPPQENNLSFEEMVLKVKNVKALRVGVLGTGTSP